VTLPLIDSWDIQPVKGTTYRVNLTCANPRHHDPAEHGHHLVRRSQIIGDVWWIRLPDGIVIGNVIGLCAPCHALVTGQGGKGGGHGAAIRWIDGALWWCDVQVGTSTGAVSYLPVAPCSPQTPLGDDATILGLDVGPKECPTCGRSHEAPKKKGPKREARKRKTWTVQVPADEGEDGAQVLDEIVDGIVSAFELEIDGGALTRYHALARAGAFVLVNRSAIPEEAKG
jgi:hypothetical protein